MKRALPEQSLFIRYHLRIFQQLSHQMVALVSGKLHFLKIFVHKSTYVWHLAKESPGQETGLGIERYYLYLGNKGRLKVLNDTKFVLNEHE